MARNDGVVPDDKSSGRADKSDDSRERHFVGPIPEGSIAQAERRSEAILEDREKRSKAAKKAAATRAKNEKKS